MKKTYLILSIALCSLPLRAQLPVTDIASIYQNMGNFMADAMEQLNHTQALSEYIMLAQEAVEKLQEVSDYVQQAKISVEIVQEGVKLAQQIKTIQSEMSQLESLTDQEIANAICFASDLGNMIAQKIDQASETLGDSNNESEMSDYERLQLLQNIKQEIKSLQEMLAKVQKRFQAKDSKEQLQAYLNDVTTCALLYGVSGGKTVLTTGQLHTIEAEMNKKNGSSTKKSTTSSKNAGKSAKSSTKTTSTKK